MATRQDQILEPDFEPDCCPLCIEELDLSDRGFRPCPCGYQICQFCYNNIKTTMNGLCPACRRPYEEKNIRFDAPSAEETARYKESKTQFEKKRAAAKKQEAASRQADNLSRKHLAGIRVRRQNLVYVTGLRLITTDPQLAEKLRGTAFFGQYGEIDKIVVNKPKDSRTLQPVGVYITFFTTDAARTCIKAIDGSQNAGVVLRADYGTTKYCSAFLRHETCSNKNCTFLHEVGEDNESFTREGLSSLNASGTQSSTSQATAPPMAHVSQPSAVPPMDAQVTSLSSERLDSESETASVLDGAEKPALPSHASWAQRNTSSRRPSQTQSHASASPMANPTVPNSKIIEKLQSVKSQPETLEQPQSQETIGHPSPDQDSADRPRSLGDPDVLAIKKILATEHAPFALDESSMTEDELKLLNTFPLLIARDGGARRVLAKKRIEERLRLEAEENAVPQPSESISHGEGAASGSLQLGGEPEDQQEHESSRRAAIAIRPPSNSTMSLNSDLVRALSPAPHRLSDRTEQQNHAQRLQSLGPGSYGSTAQQGIHGLPDHARQSSRFTFANDSAHALKSTSKFLSSSNVGPSSQFNLLQQTGMSVGQPFSSGFQGPPPGLKTSGTPPVSGGGMFGQGHGFAASSLGYGVNSASRNANDEMLHDLLRARGGSAGNGQVSDGGRRGAVDLVDPSVLRTSMGQASSASSGHIAPQGLGQGNFYNLAPSLGDPFGSQTDLEDAEFTTAASQGISYIETSSLPPGLPAPNISALPFEPDAWERAREVDIIAGLGTAKGFESERVAGRPDSLIRPISRGRNGRLPAPASRPIKASEAYEPLDSSAFPALPKPSAIDVATSKRNPASSSRLIAETQKMSASDLDKESPNAFNTPKRSSKRLDLVGKIDLHGLDHDQQSSHDPLTDVASTAGSRTASPVRQEDTPAKRNPRPLTLRVMVTPKSETPPPAPLPTVLSRSATVNASPDLIRQVSRKQSIASLNIPGTPVSERNADSVSIATESASRASSPRPIGRVGTAAIRTKTKSQVKKERAERAKTLGEMGSNDEPWPEQSEGASVGPIMGRKKKTKSKKAPNMTTNGSTPDFSRPSTPGLTSRPVQALIGEGNTAKIESDNVERAAETPVSAAAASKPQSPSVNAERPKVDPLSPLSFLSDAGGNEDLHNRLSDLLKTSFTPSGAGTRAHGQQKQDLSAAEIMAMATPKPLTTGELATLQRGEAIRRDAAQASRLMISPSRKCLPRLARELEDRYLELEQLLAESKPPARYTHSSKDSHQSHTTVDAMLMDMAAVLIRRQIKSKDMTAVAAQSSAPDAHGGQRAPVTSYASDALAYLNQFILPPLPQPIRTAPLSVSSPAVSTHANQTIAPGNWQAPFVPLGVGSAVPRTYTTGDPTYSVSGVDVNGLRSRAEPSLAATNRRPAHNEGNNDGGQHPTGSLGAYASNSNGAVAANVAAGMAMWSLGKPVTSVEAEHALTLSKKEAEAIERRLAALVKRNRRKIAGLV